MKRFARPIPLLVLLVCAAQGIASAATDSFIGMAQVSRSDGLRLYALTGTYRDRAKCEKLAPEVVNAALVQGQPRGTSAKLDFLSCDTKAPAGSEFAAMRGDAPSKRTIFFTENLRVVPVHARGTRAEEKKACDQIRQRVLTRFGVNGECLEPGR